MYKQYLGIVSAIDLMGNVYDANINYRNEKGRILSGKNSRYIVQKRLTYGWRYVCTRESFEGACEALRLVG